MFKIYICLFWCSSRGNSYALECFSERPILFGINITYIQEIKRVPFILVVFCVKILRGEFHVGTLISCAEVIYQS